MRARAAIPCVVFAVACSHAGAPGPVVPEAVSQVPDVVPQALHVIPLFGFNGGSGGGNKHVTKKDVAEGGGTGGLIGDAKTALYGVTTYGGDEKCGYNAGCGVVFELTPQSGTSRYKETVIHTFHGPDGAGPTASLTAGAVSGVLYGTTSQGGSNGYGTVFQLVKTASGFNESVIYSFTGKQDGAFPEGPVIRTAGGALIGTTNQGAGLCYKTRYSKVGCGAVYELTHSKTGWKETTVHKFAATGKDGYGSMAGLIQDASGVLFGTTEYGGGTGCGGYFGGGCGTVFKLTPSSAGYSEAVIWRFLLKGGQHPLSGVTEDSSGALYGTTVFGGSSGCQVPPPSFSLGCGTIYKLTPNGSRYSEHLLYDFTEAKAGDGEWPTTTLALAPDGELYGTTLWGGDILCTSGLARDIGSGTSGCGVIFSLGKGGSPFTRLYQFRGTKDGSQPDAPLHYSAGSFYGETLAGGSSKRGTIYELKL